jgi:hypothetical protein
LFSRWEIGEKLGKIGRMRNDFRNEKISKSVGLNLTTYKPFSIVHSKKMVQILFFGRKRACEKRGTHIASLDETSVDVEI